MDLTEKLLEFQRENISLKQQVEMYQRVILAYAQASQVLTQITGSLNFEEPVNAPPSPPVAQKTTANIPLAQQKIEEVNKGNTGLPFKE